MSDGQPLAAELVGPAVLDAEDPLRALPGESRRVNGHLRRVATRAPWQRGSRELADFLGIDYRWVQRLRKQWNWNERLEAYDDIENRKLATITESMLRAAATDYSRALRHAANLTWRAAANMGELDMSPNQLTALLTAMRGPLTDLLTGPQGVDALTVELESMAGSAPPQEQPGVTLLENLADRPDVLAALVEAHPNSGEPARSATSSVPVAAIEAAAHDGAS